MTKEDLEKYHALLTKEKEDLEKKIKRLAYPDFGDDIDSGEEHADEAEEKFTNEAKLHLFDDRLRGINEAIAKIHAGTYGICASCGKEIAEDLLNIDPESALCKDCKAKNG